MGSRVRPRGIARAGAALLALVAFGALSWWPVTTRQGIDFVVTVQRIPLWVKTSEFLARDYRYRQLADRIVQGSVRGSDQQKTMAIFHWTLSHLRHQPEGWPVVDDHVYSIIVRGYGTNDQFADVFTTLCAYAGVPATLVKLVSADRAIWYMGGVRLDGQWCVFDPYWGVYFEHPGGRPVSLQELIDDPVLLRTTQRGPGVGLLRASTPPAPIPVSGGAEAPVDYAKFVRAGVSLAPQAIRPHAHMPWMRLLQELRQALS